MSKRIYRSSTDKIFSGVCGGLGEYFGIDPVIIRLVWALLAIWTSGNFIILYIIASMVMPEDDGVIYYENDNDNRFNFENNAIFIGIALVLIGGVLLAKTIFPHFFLRFYNLRKYWPILLIIAGFYILYNYKQKS